MTWLAAYAIAMHTVLAGLVSLAAAAPVDPFSVICHSQPDGATSQSQDNPASGPAARCDNCKLCSTTAAPSPPEGLFGDLAPHRMADVLYPASTAPDIGVAASPKLARAPPQRA